AGGPGVAGLEDGNLDPVPLVERTLERRRIRMLETKAAHLYEPVAQRLEPELGGREHVVAASPHRGPVVLRLERDRVLHREERRRIACPLPAVALVERGPVPPIPSNDQRADHPLRPGAAT